MRTIEQAEKDCCAAWAAQPEATHGWCIHHGQEWEELCEPIAKRIAYILSGKPKSEQVTRLDNMRPMSAASVAIVATARKAYDEAIAPAAWRAYDEAIAPAAKAFGEATAPAAKAFDEAEAAAEKAYTKATATASKAYGEATATAHRADVPTHTWNGKSIFKSI